MRIACSKCHGRKTDGSGHLCSLCHGTGETADSMRAPELAAAQRPLARPGSPDPHSQIARLGGQPRSARAEKMVRLKPERV